jgi:hypothetical protein
LAALVIGLAGGPVAAFGLVGCGGGHPGEQPPGIEVVAGQSGGGGVELPYSVAINQWNGGIVDRVPVWDQYLQEHDLSEVPVVPLGATISISFPKPAPDRVELMEQVRGSGGATAFGAPTAVDLADGEKNGRFEFQLRVNGAAMVSSQSSDYEPGGSTRSFVLTAAWGSAGLSQDTCEYAFALHTDALCEPDNEAEYCGIDSSGD